MQDCEGSACSCGSSSKAVAGIWSPQIEELAAIGAAVGCNCVPCLKYHIGKARELGVSEEDIVEAIAIASKVKRHSAELIVQQADRQLSGRITQTVDPNASCADVAAKPPTCC